MKWIKKFTVWKEFKLIQYLKYALGEIVLIVIGIYIAIQLDNWNEKSKTREIELTTILEIRNALIADSTDFYYNLKKYGTVIKSIDSIIILFANPNKMEVSQYKYFSGALLTSYFVVNTGPYEALKSRGLETIENRDLRNKLTDYYEGRYEYVREVEKQMTNYTMEVQNNVVPRYFEQSVPYQKDNPWYGLYGSMVPDNIEELKKSQEYIRCLKAIKGKTEYYLNGPAKFTRNDLRALIASLNNQILLRQ